MQGIAERRPIFHTIFNGNLGFRPTARTVCNDIRPKYRIRRRRRHERGQAPRWPDQAGIESSGGHSCRYRKFNHNLLPQRTAGSGQHKANRLVSAPRRCGQDARAPRCCKMRQRREKNGEQRTAKANQLMSAPRRCGQDALAPGCCKMRQRREEPGRQRTADGLVAEDLSCHDICYNVH